MPFGRAMVVFAHPDDAEYSCAGTVAAWADAGTEVHYVVVTDGSAGDNRPGADPAAVAEVRRREQRDAAEVLGVSSVTFLGVRDGEVTVDLPTRRLVCREVRRLRPDVIVAPDPTRMWAAGRYVNHIDHRRVGELALCAVMPDAPSRPRFPDLLDEGLEPFEVPHLWIVSDEGDTVVDIAATLDRKVDALARHASQGGGDGAAWVRRRASDVGAAHGLAAAEAFRTFDLLGPRGEPETEEVS